MLSSIQIWWTPERAEGIARPSQVSYTSCGDDEVEVSCVWACGEGCDGFRVTKQSPDQSSVPQRCSFGLASTEIAKVKIGAVCIK